MTTNDQAAKKPTQRLARSLGPPRLNQDVTQGIAESEHHLWWRQQLKRFHLLAWFENKNGILVEAEV